MKIKPRITKRLKDRDNLIRYDRNLFGYKQIDVYLKALSKLKRANEENRINRAPLDDERRERIRQKNIVRKRRYSVYLDREGRKRILEKILNKNIRVKDRLGPHT